MFRNSLENAIGLIEKGKLVEAQKILKPLIAADHHDLAAWFWFAETCSTNKQRLNVLEICLEYNPDNEQVKQAIDKLQSTPSNNPLVRTSVYSTLSSSSGSTKTGIPDNIKVNNNFQHLHITVKWFRFKFIALSLFVIGFNAFLIELYPSAIPLEVVISVAVDIGLIYYVLAGYLNKTYIDVNFNSVIARYEPLPAWDEKIISTKTIAQLYVEGDYFFGLQNRSTGYHFYTIHVVTNGGKIVKLVQGLDYEEASFIKQEIENFLNIDEFSRLI